MTSVTADDGVWAAVLAAQVMVNFADCWSPMTEEISKVMGDGTGGPFALGEGAGKWYGAASKLQEAQQSLTELTGGLPRDYWDGDDRAAFDTEVSNLAAELGDAHNYAMAVAITLTTLTVPIGAWPLLCDGIGVVEAAMAAAFYVAAASVIGDFGLSESLFLEGEAVTGTCVSVINASMAVLVSLMAAATAAIVVADTADISAQQGHGDTGIAGEFGKAVVDSAAEVAMTVALDHHSHKGEGGEGGEGEGAGKHEAGEGGEGSEGSHEGGSGGDEGGSGSHEGGSGGDEGGSGTHEGSSGSDEGGDSGRGQHERGEGGGKHEAPEDPISTVTKDRLKEKGEEKVGEGVTPGLQGLINQGVGAAVPGWNNPDAPKPSDEQWGAGEE